MKSECFLVCFQRLLSGSNVIILLLCLVDTQSYSSNTIVKQKLNLYSMGFFYPLILFLVLCSPLVVR